MDDNFFDDEFDFDWVDLGMAGSLGEEMAEEEKKRRRLEKELMDDFYGEDEEDDF